METTLPRRLAFTLHMVPQTVQKGARIGRTKSGKAVMFNDPRKKAYFKEVALHANRYRPAVPLAGPLRATFVFVMPRPAYLYRKSDPEGLVPSFTKPDRTNLLKGTEDALSAVGFWENDSQIFDGPVSKYFAEKDGVPRIEVVIEEVAP
jgi:Holliday junction resolvase RusA-like endonuclease